MESFDLIFRSTLIKDTFEDGVSLRNDGISLCISINRGFIKEKRVQVINGAFFPCIGVSLGASFRASGCFFEVLIMIF